VIPKIALEEHFAIPETLGDSQQYTTVNTGWDGLSQRLLDIHGKRLEEMDRYGVEIMILGLNSPAIQAIWNVPQAIETARKANDYLADQIAKNPRRFRGFAALPLQDPAAAARELERCIRDLGFLGAMVNGFSQSGQEDTALYYDLPQYADFWATVERLGVPFYLHPRDALASRRQHYEGQPWFEGSPWAFNVETSIHALRLMGCGLFDRHPKLKIIIGHLGETIPFNIWRIDHRLSRTPRGIPTKRKLAEYLRENFYITTSGNFRTSSLLATMLEVGADRILFSADWPFEEISEAAEWMESASISEPDRHKIAYQNSARLFGI
jgi:2,3-dihydroxybenzoate decarboxylase